MNRFAIAAAGIVTLLLMLAGCSGESEEKLIASARAYLDKDDGKSAAIQLKTALQKNPQSGTARWLLGRALLESGDAAGALVELRKAQELHVGDDQVLPDLARTLLQLGDAAKVSAQFAGTELRDPKAAADLATSVAAAYAHQGDMANALERSERALRSQPGYTPAIVLQAQLKMANHDVDGAMRLLDEVLQKDRGNLRAGTLKAELQWRAQQDRDGAIATYRGVLAAHPRSVIARASIVRILQEQNKADGARAELAELGKVAPNHPETLYLQARAAYLANDYRAALETASRLLKGGMADNVQALELAGAAELNLKSYVQAEAHLAKALKLAPGRLLTRNLLAQSYVRSGQPGRAVEVLQAIIDNPQASGQSLAAAGEAYLQAGDAQRADAAFRRAALAAPQDLQVRTAVAIARMARGDNADAVSELENIAADDKSPRADFALISARLHAHDLEHALAAVGALQKKLPASALPDFLRGRVLALKKDPDGATRAFEAALTKDASYFPAAAGLAALDLAAGEPARAKRRFEALLHADPKNFHAQLALAELANQANDAPAEVLRHLADAVKAAPEEPQPRVLLVNFHLRAGDAKTALVAAQNGIAALPDQAEMLDALGRAQLAAHDGEQAIATFKKLSAAQPSNPLPLMRLADAYALTKDNDGARTSLKRALTIDPQQLGARRALAALALTEKHPDDALALARQLQLAAPKDGAGFALEAEVRATLKQWPAAAAALRNALQRSPSADNAIALHRVLVAGGQRADADRMAADWQREQPKDAVFRYYLGDEALARNDFGAAETQYRSVVALQPGNALALNNVAWLMVREGRPGAVALADQANKLLPGRPALLDTLAGALAAENQLPRAIQAQQQALQRSPNDANLRLNLARLYVKSGDKPQARTELQALAQLGSAFPGQNEVAELLKSLQ